MIPKSDVRRGYVCRNYEVMCHRRKFRRSHGRKFNADALLCYGWMY